MEGNKTKETKYCVFCGRRIPKNSTCCSYCGNKLEDSAPRYAPGKEPDEYQGYLKKVFSELNEKYPDGNIDFTVWNHDRWDKAVLSLQDRLGYKSIKAFLTASSIYFLI